MSQQIRFADALEAAEQLDADEQAELVAVLSRRLAERGRERVAAVVAQARREFAAGQCQPMTAAELVRSAAKVEDGVADQRKYRLPLTLGDLTVRRLHWGDAADVFAYRSDPAVACQQYWEPFTAEQVATLLADQAHVQPGMYGVPLILAAEHRGKVVGDFPLTVNIPEHAQGEVGFSFHQGYTGRGLATRTLAAVLGFGFVQFGLHRITAATFTDNERAWRMMERVGMRREAHFVHDGFVRGRWVDVYGYGMLADEWRGRHPDLLAAVSP